MADVGYTDYRTGDAEFRDYFALLKPRVMSLVVFTALVGMCVAPVGIHPVIGFAALLCIAVGAGASGALNMWWDADIDAIMRRTAKRPVPSGRVAPEEALTIGLWLSGLSVVMLALFANLLSAALLAFTIFFYAVIYTMWLKRATPQNIVIGGAAGAFPPMIGWAVATGGVSVESVLMFALIFMWTPPHFWALALFMNEDYSRAGVPMMTVARGKPKTRWLVLLYAVLLAPVALALGLHIRRWRFLPCGRRRPERAASRRLLEDLDAERGRGGCRRSCGRKIGLQTLDPLPLCPFRRAPCGGAPPGGGRRSRTLGADLRRCRTITKSMSGGRGGTSPSA